MDNTKTKFKRQLKKEKIVAEHGYGNGYTLKRNNQMIGFIPFISIKNIYYDWESNNKGYGYKPLLELIKEGGYLDKK